MTNQDESTTAFQFPPVDLTELQERCAQRWNGGERFTWRRMARAVSGYNTNVGPGGKIYMPPMVKYFRNSAVGVKFPYGRLPSGALDPDIDPYGVTSPISETPQWDAYFVLFAFSEFQDGAVAQDILPYTYVDLRIDYEVEFFNPTLQEQQII